MRRAWGPLAAGLMLAACQTPPSHEQLVETIKNIVMQWQ